MSIPGSSKGTYNGGARGGSTPRPQPSRYQDAGLNNQAASHNVTQRNQMLQMAALQQYQRSRGGMPPGGPPGGPSGGSRGGSRGGGGGYSAAAQAERQRQEQLAAMRNQVEERFNQGVGQLDQSKASAMAALPMYRDEALQRLAQVYGQNQQQTGVYGNEIAGQTGRTQSVIAAALAALQGDLRGNGVDASAMGAAGQSYQADAAARGGSAANFNDRLAQVMAMGYGDQQAAANATHQGAASNAENAYQQALAALQARRADALMGLV